MKRDVSSRLCFNIGSRAYLSVPSPSWNHNNDIIVDMSIAQAVLHFVDTPLTPRDFGLRPWK